MDLFSPILLRNFSSIYLAGYFLAVVTYQASVTGLKQQPTNRQSKQHELVCIFLFLSLYFYRFIILYDSRWVCTFNRLFYDFWAFLGYALLNASSTATRGSMSSTVTATTSPTRFPFQSTALPVPGRSGLLLTTSFRPDISPNNATPSNGLAPSNGEPPAKRTRLEREQPDREDALNRCLQKQVFPHIFKCLDTLREHEDKTLELGREVGATMRSCYIYISTTCVNLS